MATSQESSVCASQVVGVLGLPRPVERDLGRHLLEVLPHFADVGEGVIWQVEIFTTVALHLAVHGEEVLAFHVGREEANAEFLGERQDAVLGRADPLPAELDHGPVGQCVVQEPSADAVAGLQDENRNVSG